MNLKVIKFGGAALANAELISNAATIVRNAAELRQPIVVASAIQGATDELAAIVSCLNEGHTTEALNKLNLLSQRHEKISFALARRAQGRVLIFPHDPLAGLRSWVESHQNGPLTPLETDFLVTVGEPLSAALVAWELNRQGSASTVVDSAKLLTTDGRFGNATVALDSSRQLVRQTLGSLVDQGVIPVITGFYGSDGNGRITSLGRGGSDYLAACVAALMEADEVVFAKMEAGIHDRDPKRYPDASLHRVLTYQAAAEIIARDGQVLHPLTLPILEAAGISARIMDARNPQTEGTFIGPESLLHRELGY